MLKTVKHMPNLVDNLMSYQESKPLRHEFEQVYPTYSISSVTGGRTVNCRDKELPAVSCCREKKKENEKRKKDFPI
jgi:hypothetical protein